MGDGRLASVPDRPGRAHGRVRDRSRGWLDGGAQRAAGPRRRATADEYVWALVVREPDQAARTGARTVRDQAPEGVDEGPGTADPVRGARVPQARRRGPEP